MKFIYFISCFFYLNLAISQTFMGGSGAILDNQTIDIPLTISGLSPSTIDTSTFGLEQICFNLTHSWDADISMTLISPDGNSVILFSAIGADGDNMQNTCLRSDVSNPINTGTAPFNGLFKPLGQMGLLNNGQNPNGTWILRIQDGYTGDEGNLTDWSLTFGNNPATFFTFTSSNLPIVVINTNGQTIIDDPKITADMGIIYNGNQVRNYLTDPKNNYNGKISIEIRGNYSASLPQKPYSFELQDVNGNQIDASLLGMPAENDWLLIANYNDKSFARNITPYHLFDTMGHYATRNKLVDVVLNGEYQGIYMLCEEIKRDINRVDIAKLAPIDISGQELTGGYILKFDYWDYSNSWQLSNSPIGFPGLDVHMVYYSPKAADLMPEQKTYIQTFINDYETALYSPSFSDEIVGYRKYIDVTSFIDYFLINELTRNTDGFKKSRYFSKDKDHADGSIRKLQAGPVWDFDWSQKDMNSGDDTGANFNYNNPNQDIHAPGWYIRLLEDTLFANEMRCRYEDLRRTILSQQYIFKQIDSVATVVNESQVWHYETWGNLGIPTGTYELAGPSQTYSEEIQRLKDWYTRRLTWLDANLPGTLYGCSFAGETELKPTEVSVVSFPNPFESYIYIQFNVPVQSICVIRLTDHTGRIVKVQEVDAADLAQNSYLLKDLENLNNGMYVLEIETEKQMVVKKIIK
jgi:subtilisin-like proprotein convertase family protein